MLHFHISVNKSGAAVLLKTAGSRWRLTRTGEEPMGCRTSQP